MRRKIYLFIYGTLRKEVKHPIHQVLARHGMLIGTGSFQGKLYDLGRYPGAVASRKRSDRVSGEIYQLRRAATVFELLDDYEGEFFRRDRVLVSRDGAGKLTAWVYLYLGPVKESRRVINGDYLDFRTHR